MDDKLKVFWNLDVLVKMCRSKSDGPSLRVEESEIDDKIKAYTQEIEEIKALTEEDSYDTSAEMADRNIEIITKKQLQTLKNELKDKNKELNKLKEIESSLYEHTSLLRDNKSSQEKYIVSMQERIAESVDSEIIDRYNALIAETSEKIAKINEELTEQNSSYEDVQNNIVSLTDEIAELEDKIDKKKKLLSETQANLENKDNYIDKSKREKNNKRIVDLETKIDKLKNRIVEIKNDPKYLESKIKDVINNKEDISQAKQYLTNLINQVIKVKYINVPADNALEEELLRATQARDSFANEIDQKSYNILEANTPEKVRTEFLTERIEKWQNELEEYNKKISQIDRDQQYDYENKNMILSNMIATMKNDLKEFQRAYDEAPDINISAKASLKAALEAQKEDIREAEKIATAFKKDEAEDIATATRTIKYECENLNNQILNAETEIKAINNRLTSKKSGLIDISSRNKDKDILKELAQTVIDIKHRRQFPETPIEIVRRLEEELSLSIIDEIDMDYISKTSSIEEKDYEDYINNEYEVVEEIPRDTLSTEESDISPEKRGIKVIHEAEIASPEELDTNPAANRLEAAIEEISNNENNQKVNVPAEEEQITILEETNPEEVSETSQEEQPEDNIAEEAPIIEDNQSEEIPVMEEEPVADEPVKEEMVTEEQPTEESNEEERAKEIEEPLDIEEIINQSSTPNSDDNSSQPESKETEEEPIIELSSSDDGLSINSIFNQSDSEDDEEDSSISSRDLEADLDNYLKNIDLNKNK